MITINNKWAIDSDESCVTLYRLNKNKKQTAVGYYPNFTSALKSMIDKEIQSLDELKFMCNKLDQLKSDIKTMFKNASEAP